MALQSQGTPENPVPISFSQIEAEFGDGGSSRNIGKYRVSKTVGGMINLPLDDGIPQGDSSIAFSDFYGKQLNIIVSFDENENRPPEAKTKYINNNERTVIGGFRDKPNNSSGSKVILHVHPNKTIGSSNNSRTHCALRTGSGWAGTELEINIGSNALVSGAGGDGGDGGKPDGETDDDAAARGFNGSDGSSAIGIDYPVDKIVIESGATVRAGGGGGGGGGGAAGELDESNERVGGGGGGGGQGVPGGLGGEAGSDSSTSGAAYSNVEIQPLDGEDGSATEGGDGGTGGVNNEGNSNDNASAQSGGGGGGGGQTVGAAGTDYRNLGGSDGDPATDGGSGAEEGEGGRGGRGDAEGEGQQEGPGGSGGLPGFAITNSTEQGSVTIVNNGGTISGATNGTEVS